MVNPGSRLNIRRGLIGALVCAAIGAIVSAGPLLLLDLDFLARRWRDPVKLSTTEDYLFWAQNTLTWPVVGCAFVLGAAGWATYAPRGKYRFVTSLAIVFAASLCTWWTIKATGWLPLRLKAYIHPTMYTSEAIALASPPLFVAIILTCVRTWRSEQ